ncbi:hypothetical protein [Lactobacillus sp.]|uniref:hypothetical protein n=1 Tax=Lactobacillus sp. TaxID=1591 RepID=UPI003EF258BF
MEEIEFILDKWLANTIFSEPLYTQLKEKEISIACLIFNKYRLTVISDENKQLIKAGMEVLEEKFKPARKSFLEKRFQLKSEAEEAAYLLLDLFLHRTKKLQSLSAKELQLLALPEMKDYILLGQRKAFIRNNLFGKNIISKVDMVTLDEIIDCPHPTSLDFMLAGKITKDTELEQHLELFGPIYEVEKFGDKLEENMEWGGFRHASHVNDQRVYYLIKFLEPARQGQPKFDSIRNGMLHYLNCYNPKY